MSHPASKPCLASVLIALCLFLVSPLRAQELDSLPAGARLRATLLSPSRPLVGTLVRATPTGLVLASEAGQVLLLSHNELGRVERSLGRVPRGRGFRSGAKVGFLVGAGVGAVATALALNADLRGSCSECMIPATAVIGLYSLVFTATTTVIGGGIGVANRERWRQVWPSR